MTLTRIDMFFKFTDFKHQKETEFFKFTDLRSPYVPYPLNFCLNNSQCCPKFVIIIVVSCKTIYFWKFSLHLSLLSSPTSLDWKIMSMSSEKILIQSFKYDGKMWLISWKSPFLACFCDLSYSSSCYNSELIWAKDFKQKLPFNSTLS